jgi:hypothetical protein
MSCWGSKGNGICGTCGREGPRNIEVLRALGWHYGNGDTIGGAQYEVLLCPACAKDEKRRVVRKPSIEQDSLPIDWGQYAAVEKGQGGNTR